MKQYPFILLFFIASLSYAQVGINTTTPEGTLDVTTVNNTGLVLPRVTSVESVTNGSGGLPVNGTTVYDISRSATCFYQNDAWSCLETDENGDTVIVDVPPPPDFDENDTIDYIKASNTNAQDAFGRAVALSGDGNTMVVGAYDESSSATGVNGNQSSNSASDSGAAYVFVRTGDIWSQEAYIKASNTGVDDWFGWSVSISADGNTIAVGSMFESSGSTGIGGSQTATGSDSGAVYIFTRSGAIWSQEEYIKASNTGSNDRFGRSVSLSSDGNTLAVGANTEDSATTGINGLESDNSAADSGAVYVFVRSGTTWSQQAYIKASNTDADDSFGFHVSLSADATTLAVGAIDEDSTSTTINSGEGDNSGFTNGAVYIFTRSGATWSQEAYLKPTSTDDQDVFGYSVSLSANGNKLAVGVRSEDSASTGINGVETDNSAVNSGAAYVFSRSGTVWSQEAYLKASNAEASDWFGQTVSISANGNTILVSSLYEESNSTTINSGENDNSASDAGAAYVYNSLGNVWSQQSYIKASNTEANDWFGWAAAISGDAQTIAVGAYQEDSNATGINGDQTNNSFSRSGAVYIITDDNL